MTENSLVQIYQTTQMELSLQAGSFKGVDWGGEFNLCPHHSYACLMKSYLGSDELGV